MRDSANIANFFSPPGRRKKMRGSPSISSPLEGEDEGEGWSRMGITLFDPSKSI